MDFAAFFGGWTVGTLVLFLMLWLRPLDRLGAWRERRSRARAMRSAADDLRALREHESC